MEILGWGPFLDRWNAEWAAAPRTREEAEEDGSEDKRAGERRILTAVADTFGLSLPRFAIQHGRLHTVMTGPWTRPPGPGEQRLVFVRHRTPAPKEEP
ncbi:hypothetical protein ACIBBB_08360 [Streptomyces sp. NPDC051217]|uniref:hypothetical protein n=1 Tax=Streptomyces sp. NPDC051217 TaxID=3365644 RepID=UPI003790DD91